MERLTKSPYIVDIYSYCGQTAINEYAHFDSDMTEFRHFTKKIRSMKSKKINMMKLKVGAMLALGLQHIHEVDGINNTTLMHYDINPSNVMITEGGIPKFNDFNVAHFFYWDQVNNRRCPYVGHLKTPLWRSPEEMQETGFIDGKLQEIEFEWIKEYSVHLILIFFQKKQMCIPFVIFFTNLWEDTHPEGK